MIGRVVGSYRIVSQIGEGGMGTVYRAVDTMLDREVALKAIRSDLSQEPHMVERFRTEAKTLARINHPAIVTIYAFFHEGEEIFLAMEYIRGGNLSKVMETEGALPWQRAVSLLASVLDGIEAAHRAGVVHRDLKPENLMLTEAGTLKVMDFGLARMAGSSRLTRTGILVGTLRYMAPEQIQGGEVDARTDVYALGVVLYQMLTGCTPFDEGSDYAILKAQVEDTPVPPVEHVPNIPGWLNRTVLQALEKDPARRFQSVGELHAVLTRGETTRAGIKATRPEELEDLPTLVLPRSPLAAKAAPTTRTGPPPIPAAVSSPPPQASYRPVEIPRPSGWKRSALGIAAVFLVAFLGLFLWPRHEVPEQTALLEPEPTPIQSPVQIEKPAPSLAAGPESALQETVSLPQPLPASPPRREPAPAPPPRSSTPAPVPEVREEKVEAEPASAEEPVETEPALDPMGAAHEDLHQIGSELVTGSEHLLEVYEVFLEQKEDGGSELTDNDEKLLEELEVLGEAAERFNKKLKDGFVARLRNRGADQKRAEVARRARELADAGQRVERLMSEVRPGSEVRQAWQDVKRRWQRAVELAGR